MEEMVAEEGSILAPEGSSVEDGSIIAAGGIVLAPPGTVMMGEDGKLMMAENSALLAQEGRAIIGAGTANVLTDEESPPTLRGPAPKKGKQKLLH